MSLPIMFSVYGGALSHVLSARAFAASDALETVKAALEAEGLDPARYEVRSGGIDEGEREFIRAFAKRGARADPAESEAEVRAVHRLLLRLRTLTADAGEAAGLAGFAAAQWEAEWAVEEDGEDRETEGDAPTVKDLVGRVMLLCADLYAATGHARFRAEVERWMLWRRLLRGDLRARWGL